MKRSDNFQKFEKKPKGSAIKEQIKQEKKKAKKERAEAIEKHFAKKREERALQRGSTTARESFRKKEGDSNSAAPKKSYKNYRAEGKKIEGTDGFKKDKKQVGRGGKSAPAKRDQPEESKRVDFKSTREQAQQESKPSSTKRGARDEKIKSTSGFKKNKEQVGRGIKPVSAKRGPREETKPVDFKGNKEQAQQEAKPSSIKREARDEKTKSTGGFKKNKEQVGRGIKPASAKREAPTKNIKASKSEKAVGKLSEHSTEKMPLNKYIAHSGVCARRDAAILVKDQKVTVNGEIVTDPGTKVTSTDVIQVSGKKITPSKNFVYILLNKPKDFITTLDDPQGRRTVLDLVRQATSERIYPVGRLDRNTSGVLLLTNDGELAQKLSHPKHEIKKVYEVKLDRNLTKGDMDKIAEGITLEDGFIAPDVIAYADAKDKSVIGIEIHSGRNRIVRRIFEHMKYNVRALDRVMYAGLTKKNVLRGNWRFLSEKEVRLLKFMNQSFVKPKAE